MSTITIGLIMFVALEFLFIMYLETLRLLQKRTQRVFNLSKEELERPFTEYIVQKSRNL